MRNALRIFTNSERSASACPRKWRYRYVERLSEWDSPAPLRQGTLIHQLLAFWYRCSMEPTITELTLHVGAPWLEKRTGWVDDNVHDTVRADELRAEDQEIYDESVGMIDHYIQTYGANDRADWKILHVEANVARPMPFFDAHQGLPRWWVFAGQLDLVIEERSTGMKWIVEHKSTDQKDMEKYLRKLHLDPQIRGYDWALLEPAAVGDVKEPIEVDGVLYNVLRKKVPRVPPMLKAPKPTKKTPNPVSPGLSKAAIDTTRAVFMGEIERQKLDPDDYADLLSDLERNRFFARERYPLALAELADWERDTMAWLKWASAAELDANQPRQTQVCCGIAASQCSYESICLVDGEQARASYVVKTVRHEELAGVLADPMGPIGKARAPTVQADVDLDGDEPEILSDGIRAADPVGSAGAEEKSVEADLPAPATVSNLDDLGPDPFDV